MDGAVNPGPEVHQVVVGPVRHTVHLAGRGPLVVCLHGFPDNAESFRHQVPVLVAAGYRVACPLLPGYEPDSLDRDGRYDLERVSERVLALCETLRENHSDAPGQPLHLVGHDWGAIIGYACAVQRPDLFRSLTAVTIPYPLRLTRMLRLAPAYLRSSGYIQFFQTPWLPELLLSDPEARLLEYLWREWSPGWTMPSSARASIRATLSQPGVIPAALGYYRAIPGLWPRHHRSRALVDGVVSVPTLAVEGTRDGCIHSHLWRLLSADRFPAGLRHARIEAGHFPHQEQPEAFNEGLLSFLRRH